MRGSAFWILAVVVAAAPASADTARPREEGDRSSAAGSRHHGSSDRGSSGSHSPSDSASSSDHGTTSHSSPPTTAAQRRHPRAGTGTGGRDRDRGRGHYYGYPYGYSYGYPYYGYGYYGRYYPYGYSGYGYYGSYYGGGYPHYRRSYRDAGSVRVQVKPEHTRVYVDGYYAGVADDFDGIFQRLHVSPGRHEITLKLEGYRTHRFRVYAPPDHTIKLHYDMVRGAGEDTDTDVVGEPFDDRRFADDDRDRWDDERDRDRYGDRREAGSDAGRVRLAVRPGDASVYVDGEFRGNAREVDVLRLAPGRHRVEVVRPGFRTVEREVTVEPGRTVDLDVELERS